jgi:hypothetical protein
MRTDYSYIGSGRILARKVGTATPFRDIGNCSALTLGVEQEQKRLRDFRSPGGGTYNQVDRITGVTLAITAHDLSPENLALALYGSVEAVAGGVVTDEPVVAYEGGYCALAGEPASITSVKSPDGLTTYTAGTDYIFQYGAIYLPTTTTIPAPVAGAANIEVTYVAKAGDLVQALTASASELELIFLGLNEADSGSSATVKVWRGKFGPASSLPLIGDDYASLEMTGAALADSSKTGGTSQYFQSFAESA